VSRVTRLVRVTTPRRRTTAAILIQENATTVASRGSLRWLVLMVAAVAAWIWLDHPILLFAVGLTTLGAANSAYAWYRFARYRVNDTRMP
jgi:hypothetical protein